ncbi:hypothetical protein QW060_08165 [Myroides ceti]|uniref:Uncharacterized protein n=1 Tax=Paenimyroides ceti TaxID=395087 RepID=A0ABT8CTZ8_9FLAO|nr:hypothetical protein [Paenimyroides ceti]MDN3707108.1 hypothetical protein [Paenimyroides ceti]
MPSHKKYKYSRNFKNDAGNHFLSPYISYMILTDSVLQTLKWISIFA